MPHHSSVSRSRDYADASAHSPVPSLTNDASRSSSVSSSVNSLSPDTLVTTPRDLMPQFKSTATSCVVDMDGPDRKKRPLSADTGGSVGEYGMVDTPHKRRRESSAEDTESKMAEESKVKQEDRVQTGEMERKAKRRDAEQQPQKSRKRRPLTGKVDFVRKFGLTGLYREFVRPYVGDTRQQLPDLASAYLKNVKGSVHHPGASLDLLGLVMAPPKNEFDSLDLLPMASIKAAFNIGTRPGVFGSDSASDSGHKRSRISLKMSTDSQTPSPRPGSHDRYHQHNKQTHNYVKQEDGNSNSATRHFNNNHHNSRQHHHHHHQNRQNSPSKA
ncbi:hypothetical protein IW140_004182 [Coemansia sp. RSA 1813]|nr:hypothetical protein EV178_002274 [Coemansia sp. RSA 1646]KAJ1765234.1 hypothetical protein LPJ74_006432 [Coemansia sp. RSA 1843]KAJ2090034.1 hypothetical protein IW138_003003 [Coemansia sp. RSA 986]KAJ2217006.1 hypothetical protein EV179_000773 [Coemansia sp. RSA 487]KAJ2568093.1 hypothetical protein IW140_004182 [Coemansia sp. RSA 1813]